MIEENSQFGVLFDESAECKMKKVYKITFEPLEMTESQITETITREKFLIIFIKF